MSERVRQGGLLFNPVFQVVVAWLGLIVIPLLLIAFVWGILGVSLGQARGWYAEHQYVQPYLEAAVAGLIPSLFALLNRDRLSHYGLTGANLVRSLALSLLVVAAAHIVAFLESGQWFDHAPIEAHLGLVARLWYAAWGIFANGPLEVFFFVWLVASTDRIFKSETVVWSRGFLITTLLFALFHIVSTQSVLNASHVLVIFFCLGLIYKYTRNAVGPVLGWTLINGMVLAFVSLLFQP